MKSNSQETFKLNATITGKMRKGTEFPQSPGHADPTGTLDTDISFEGVVIKNTENVVFRITKVNDRGNKQIEEVRERGMQEITVGQILSVDELTGWDIQPI
jgi:hypothetical protein